MEDMIKANFTNDSSNIFWYGVIDLFLTNTEIFSQLLTRLYQTPIYQTSCHKFLCKYLELEHGGSVSKEDFSNLWNMAVDRCRREREAFSSKFISLGKSKATEEYLESFDRISSSIPIWVSYLDKHRINSMNDILKTLAEFNTQSAFEDKERYFNIVGSQISTLQAEIESSPTQFSFNILRSQLGILTSLVDTEFGEVTRRSKPVIVIKVLGESIIQDGNVVTASINISNKSGSAPISWFLLEKNAIDNSIEFYKTLKVIKV